MKIKKLAALALAAAMVTPLLGSCGDTIKPGRSYIDENGKKIYTYVFNMYVQDDKEFPKTTDTQFDQMIKEKFGIQFFYDRIPRTDWQTKTNTYFATGEAPDVTVGGKEPNYKSWAADRFLEAIDYSKLPNWQALWPDKEQFDKMIDLASSSDGKLYYLPSVRQEKVQMSWLYRKDVFDKLGLKFPKTTEEFYQVCKKLKEAYPDKVIVSSNGQKKSSLTGFFQAFWIPEMVMQDHSYVDPKTGEFVPYALTTDTAREMYIYINKLYKEGLIDKEILSMEKDQFYTRLSQDNAFLSYNYVYNTELFNSKCNKDSGANWAWAGDMVTAFPEKGTIYKRDPYYSNWGPAFSRNVVSEEGKFDAILKFFDWCASEEGQLYLTYGIEGESFQYNDKGEPEVMEGWYHETKNTKGKKLTAEFGALGAQFIKHPVMFQEIRGNMIDQLYESYNSEDNYYFFEQQPMRYTEEEEKDFTDLQTALSNKRDEYMARFLMGQSDPNSDADWNQYITDMKKVGLDEFCKLQTTVYERTQQELKD